MEESGPLKQQNVVAATMPLIAAGRHACNTLRVTAEPLEQQLQSRRRRKC